VDLRIQIIGRDHDAEFALQSVGKCFGNLHGQIVLVRCALPVRGCFKGSKPSRPRRVVRAEGFEPPRLSPLEPKSSASTSSATPAKGIELPGTPGGAAYITLLRPRTIEMGNRKLTASRDMAPRPAPRARACSRAPVPMEN